MPPKPATAPLPIQARIAPHVQAALAKAVQAKLPDPRPIAAAAPRAAGPQPLQPIARNQCPREEPRVLQGFFPGGPPRTVQAKAGPAGLLPADLAGVRSEGRGLPLPDPVRRKMETFFAADFSAVRVHVGSAAASIGALAFTMGSSIHFAHGQYRPGTPQGERLLAHELTHVVQQRAGRVRNPSGQGLVIVQDPRLEAEAERMGQRVGTQPRPAAGRGAGELLQCAKSAAAAAVAAAPTPAAAAAAVKAAKVAGFQRYKTWLSNYTAAGPLDATERAWLTTFLRRPFALALMNFEEAAGEAEAKRWENSLDGLRRGVAAIENKLAIYEDEKKADSKDDLIPPRISGLGAHGHGHQVSASFMKNGPVRFAILSITGGRANMIGGVGEGEETSVTIDKLLAASAKAGLGTPVGALFASRNKHAEDNWFLSYARAFREAKATRLEILDSAPPCPVCRQLYIEPLSRLGITIYLYTFRDDEHKGAQWAYRVSAGGTLTSLGEWKDSA